MHAIEKLLFIASCRLVSGSRVSASAYIKGSKSIRIGRKCKIHGNSLVDATHSKGIVFGDQVTLNRGAYVQGGSQGVRLGNRVEINNFSIINGTGGVDIGDDTLIGPGVRIIAYQHEYAAGQTIRSQPTIGKPIRIGQDCWIGANAVILAGVSIGDGSVIAAGAVVTRDVSPGSVMAGIPARILKMRGQ